MQLALNWDTALEILKGDAGVGVALPYGECPNTITEWYYLRSVVAFDRTFSATTNEEVFLKFDKYLDGLLTANHRNLILDEARCLLSKVQEFEGTHVGQTRFVRLKLEHGFSRENVPHIDYTGLGLLEWTRALRVFWGPTCLYCNEEHVNRAFLRKYNECHVRQRLKKIST